MRAPVAAVFILRGGTPRAPRFIRLFAAFVAAGLVGAASRAGLGAAFVAAGLAGGASRADGASRAFLPPSLATVFHASCRGGGGTAKRSS